MPKSSSFKRFLPNEQATDQMGEAIAPALGSGDVVALHGELGMGKTAVARAIIRALAGDSELEVPSPTFTLVQSYALTVPVHHFDLYRLSDEAELEELGFSEAVADGIVLVEWPQRAPGSFDGAIHIELREKGEGREVEFKAPDKTRDRLMQSLSHLL